MAFNGNQPPFNRNWPATIAGASYPLARQTPFDFTARTFLAPPTFQHMQRFTFPAPDFQQNISNNGMLPSQVATLQNDYESRIRQLNQEICHLRSSGQQKLHNLGQQCATLNGELLKKDSELETLKQSKDRKIRELREKLGKLRDDNDILTKKKLGEDSCKNHSSQISELQQSNNKLSEENEVLKKNLKGSDKSNKKLREENEALKKSLKSSDKSNKKLREENEVLKKNLKGGDTEQLKSDLDTCRVQMESCSADLQKEREEKNGFVAERDRLKADLTTANDYFDTAMERITKLDLKLKVQEEKYTTEIKKLKEVSANSLQLKADLELAKVSIEELTINNEKLADELSAKSAECERVSKLYKKSLTSRPRNVRKTFMNFPGPSSVMTAANSNTVDLNATIDLTTNDSDDESPSSSKKRK
ncbi:hypothetical protein Ddc_16366 [Ditylenchus destructor]|nr:hypothetical protein Ddc_16366 [Ditylenchus destructor]